MKGYPTKYGYLGLTKSGWILFATENEYKEYMKETDV